MVGVDVEVVDAGLNRLAGTGLYASGVGENIRAEGEPTATSCASGARSSWRRPR
ncbi:MAG: hypothetical protein ACLSHC_01185 [Bilophila wadsworthia]